MITAILAMFVVWCLFYSHLPSFTLVLLCVGLGATLFLLGKHRHTHFLPIDVLALTSRLNKVNPSLKFWTSLVLMILCVSARSPVVGLFLTASMLLLTVFIGGLALHEYVRLLTLPISFLLVSGLSLLFEVTTQSIGVLSIPIGNLWFCVSTNSQTQTAIVMARALGGISCLYLFSLTTPFTELIGVLRLAHCPDVVTELMYLIYRYIFILLSMYHTMRDAAASRLGFADYRASMRTTGNLYANLLSRSYRQANRNFDAMESRCYDTGIRFLENRKKITGIQAATAVGMIVLTFGLSILFC